jgi:Na+/H+-dicarboxylate symporter
MVVMTVVTEHDTAIPTQYGSLQEQGRAILVPVMRFSGSHITYVNVANNVPNATMHTNWKMTKKMY